MQKIIVALGLDFEQNEISSALTLVKGVDVKFFSLLEIKEKQSRLKVLDYIRQHAKAVIIKDISWEEGLENFFKMLTQETPSVAVIPLGAETISQGICTIDHESVQIINKYFIYGGEQNVIGALSYIQAKLLENAEVIDIPDPQPMPFNGIFHPEAQGVFSSLDSYLEWHKAYIKDQPLKTAKLLPKFPRVGLLIHRSSWISSNLSVESALIKELESLGICVIPVFNDGSHDPELGTKDFEDIVASYFCREDFLEIDALINLQIFVMTKDHTAKTVFEQAVETMISLNIPIFKPLISFTSSVETWMESMDGLAMEIPWSFTVPETQGMIEPIIIGCRDKKRRSVPLPERITRFASRVSRWVNLKNKPNREKKLALFIHNAPCSGVEATIGLGAGLNVFSSVVNILERLKKEGWRITDSPSTGKELRDLVMEKKAYSDFRWTCVEDILESGGCIYQMPLQGKNGYQEFYEQLSDSSRKHMEETWGIPPGEGMVFENKLAITGLNFGNVVLMVQPKRGCYGAKCTGEVCKILQDPLCPPPHQYFATYRYVEEIFESDAVLHVGTHGSLEFLPGKTNAMSGNCYPDAVLGSLPNLYIYNAGVGTEAILAKRRSNAVIIDHFPPVYSAIDTNSMKLTSLIGEYLEAVYIKSGQVEAVEKQLRLAIAELKGAKETVESKPSFYEGVILLKNRMIQSLSKPRNEKLHEFGVNPTLEDAAWYTKEIIQSEDKINQKLSSHFEDELNYHNFMLSFIKLASRSEENGSSIALYLYPFNMDYTLKTLFDLLAIDIKEIYTKLESMENELSNLMIALNGGYVPPGPSGMPDENGRNIMPTGRNIYLMDIDKIPTKAAYEVGSKAANALLEKYLEDEGKLPEKIAMNMISLDISRSKGEQLSQILYLLGITPIWDKNNKVIGLDVLSTDMLKRPRIDVTVRISGVLRDCYPQAIELMDRAVSMAANLKEDETINYVKKHTQQIARMLSETGIIEGLERRSTIRIFGDRPGTYGAGVDLALKASAWKNESDLARTFVYFSSYAYGKALKGDPALHEFIENVKGANASYDTTNSKRYDILSSSFGASVQGGIGLVKKILQGTEIRQYHGSGENPGQITVQGLKEKLKETLDETLFNPFWKENVKQNGCEGASQVMHRLQNIFEWQCLTDKVEDTAIDRLVTDYINDPVMQQWFKEYNPFALEEAARRFLELQQRDKWNPDPDVLEKLKMSYLNIEGDMEGKLGEVKGDIQAGNIEIICDSEIKEWKDKLREVDELFGKH